MGNSPCAAVKGAKGSVPPGSSCPCGASLGAVLRGARRLRSRRRRALSGGRLAGRGRLLRRGPRLRPWPPARAALDRLLVGASLGTLRGGGLGRGGRQGGGA